MKRQSYFDYLHEVDVIVSMPKASFIYDEIICFIDSCALPKPVSFFLLQEAFHEKFPWVNDEYNEDEIELMDLESYQSYENPKAQCAASYIAFMFDNHDQEEAVGAVKRFKASTSRRTKDFGISPKYRKFLKALFKQLTIQLNLFKTEQMAERYAEILTTEDLLWQNDDIVIQLNCKTKLFANVLYHFKEIESLKITWQAFNMYPVLYSQGNEAETLITAQNIKKTINDIEKSGAPDGSDDMIKIYNKIRVL